jgi:hypothetical protein
LLDSFSLLRIGQLHPTPTSLLGHQVRMVSFAEVMVRMHFHPCFDPLERDKMQMREGGRSTSYLPSLIHTLAS